MNSQLISLGVVLLAPILSYVVAAKKMSGRIDSSEASSLWEESRLMRQDYRERVGALEGRILSLEQRVVSLERDNATLRAENTTLHAENSRLQSMVAKLRERVDALVAENLNLRKGLT